MEKQSARLLYRGKDHKDIIFNGNYHNALIKGGNIIWYKIYDNYCISLSGDVIDIDQKRVVLSGVTDVMQCEGTTLIAIKQNEENVEKIYSSIGMILWKKIKEVSIEGYTLGRYYRQRSPHNSIIYEKYSGNMLYLKVLKYVEGEIQERNVEISLLSDYESSYFYNDHIFVNNSDLIWICEETETAYIVHIVHEDGSAISKSYKKREIIGYPYGDYYSPLIYAHDTNKAYYVRQELISFSPYPQRMLELYSIDENGNTKREGLMNNGYGQLLSFEKRFVISVATGFVICLEGVNSGAVLYPEKDYTGGGANVTTKETTLPLYNRYGSKVGNVTTHYGNDVSYCGIATTKHPKIDRLSFIWQYQNGGEFGEYVVFRSNGFVIEI